MRKSSLASINACLLDHPGTMLENVEDRPRARPPPTEGALVAAVALPARLRQAHQDSAGCAEIELNSYLFTKVLEKLVSYMTRQCRADIKMASFKGHVSLREVNGPDLPKSITHLRPTTPESALYHHSRYRTEFEEVSFLAKGGFGAVYR